MVNVCNERSTFYLTCTFKDQTGSAVNPDVSSYRIDNPKTKTTIRDWTALSPSQGVVVITVNLADNTRIQNLLHEKRILTIRADYGSTGSTAAYTDGVKDTFSWEIQSLEFLGSTE